MKRVIYKYPLNPYGLTTISTNSDPKVLSAQYQQKISTAEGCFEKLVDAGHYEELVVWIEQDEESVVERDEVKIYVVGTGHIAEEWLLTHYISTVQSAEGYVWHVYQTGWDGE